MKALAYLSITTYKYPILGVGSWLYPQNTPTRVGSWPRVHGNIRLSSKIFFPETKTLTYLSAASVLQKKRKILLKKKEKKFRNRWSMSKPCFIIFNSIPLYSGKYNTILMEQFICQNVCGATTFSKTTFSILCMLFRIIPFRRHYDIMLSVVILNAFMLNVMAPYNRTERIKHVCN